MYERITALATHMPSPQPSSSSVAEVTALLDRWSAGEVNAREELVPLVYRELRSLAEQRMRREPGNHTLQPTALVHEAWLRLDRGAASYRNRAHFFAAAALGMRAILVDHAR